MKEKVYVHGPKVSVIVDEAMHRAIKQAAQDAGVGSQEWIRSLIAAALAAKKRAA